MTKANNSQNEYVLATPHHVALIMDGNGRWAKKRFLPRSLGHQAGVEAMRRIIQAADELEIKVLTFYAFSTENWSRPEDEVKALMHLPIVFLEQDLGKMMQNNIKMIISGRTQGIPQTTQKAIQTACERTAGNTGLVVNLAFNYGGRSEIIDAAKLLIQEVIGKGLNSQEIAQLDEKSLAKFLYHPEIPDPDLIIRAAGEQRLSNFLIWQAAYAEYYFSPKFWPDFDRNELKEIIDAYRRRERRYGGLNP